MDPPQRPERGRRPRPGSGMGVDAGSAGARSTRSTDYPLLRRSFKPDRVRFWLAERRGNGWPSRCPGATVNGGMGMNPAGTLQPDETHAVLSGALRELEDRKSTRLNSSHITISYAVF